ncbi:origin recognition complex 4 like AAA+ ATPase [Cryptosporidium ubiquitum]|uniref:Origin recognition complex 4 like AAA+ ATPase n=1 Tax=Cryptosporidium ubiquitum TaxID=857276 RepID=A0A1J4MBX9_9CRYT|nr:origin recognition complex 4 like AAA+ ATPase [Cryptosporidium ubiquitum]OII71729.1 origin recognition complex 4 like AAA+ ATPase [Cryptosporidium ubiquitum]
MRKYRCRELTKFINRLLVPFLDSKDSVNGFVITHICLLIGISIPIFKEFLLKKDVKDFDIVSATLGIATVGVGDAFSAIFGILFGRICLPGNKDKTLIGMFAFFISTYSYLQLTCFFSASKYSLSKLYVISFFSSLLEAYSHYIDNATIPENSLAENQISRSHNYSAVPNQLENILDQIVINSTSRSCILIGKPCTGKTKLIYSYFNKKKTENISNELIIIHLNCLNYDDNTLLSALLERINEQFPMHRKLFSGHQKISILKEKLLGLSKCGYTIVLVLDNCEPIIVGSSNASHLNSNITGYSSRQFALYTLVDIMHSSEINLILILSTSMFDLPDFFEKRVKSRMSQRRILLEELVNFKKQDKVRNALLKAEELLKIDKKSISEIEELNVDSYNDSVTSLFSYLLDENKESREILKYWEFLVDFEMESEILSNLLYQFLLLTPFCSIKEFMKIFSISNKKNIQKTRNEFRLLKQGVKVQECMKLRRFESLSIIQHTILVAIIKLISMGIKNITFKKIIYELNSLKNHISVQSNLSGLNLNHTEESYKSSFLMMVKMGVIEPAYNIKGNVSYNTMSTTPVKFTQHKLYNESIRLFNIPTVLQYWLKNNILK